MQKYRKKPVVIEAEQWFPGKHVQGVMLCAADPGYEDFGVIDTLEGRMRVTSGDWIIKGVMGEFYPCKPNVFAATYESVGE